MSSRSIAVTTYRHGETSHSCESLRNDESRFGTFPASLYTISLTSFGRGWGGNPPLTFYILDPFDLLDPFDPLDPFDLLDPFDPFDPFDP